MKAIFRLTSGDLLDGYFYSNTTGKVWRNAATQAMVVDLDANATISQQAVALVESVDRPGTYSVDIPDRLPPDVYTISIRKRLGGSPAEGDNEVFTNTSYFWNGITEIPATPSPSPIPVLSFSTTGDGDVYFNSRLYSSAWTAADYDSKQQSLNDATRILDRFWWKGIVTTVGQPHSWPRQNLFLECALLDKTVVPSQIIEAQFEIAIALLKGYDPERDMRAAGVISRGYSSVRVAYDPTQVLSFTRYGIPSAAAWNLILPFLDFGSANDLRLHRVS